MRRRSKRRHSPGGGGVGGWGEEEEEEEVKAKVLRPLRRQGEEPEKTPPPPSSTRRYHHHKTYASPNHKTYGSKETPSPGSGVRRNHHHKTYERRAPISKRLEPRQHGGAAGPGGAEGRAGSIVEAERSLPRNNHERENGFPDGVTTTTTNGDVSKHSQPPLVNAQTTTNSSAQPRSSHARSRRSSSRSRSTSSRGHGRKSGSCEDDDEGHMVYDTGLVLRERFEVVSSLGEGAFAKVVRCIDRHNGRDVALKIIKNIDRYREAARSEVEVLEEIRRLDDDDRFAVVKMLEWFDHHGHVCIVFELLGLSTFDFLKHNDFLPFSVEQIRHMAFQVVKAVCFLHRNKLTHTDLKPENILFVCSDYHMEHNAKMRRDERTLRSLDVKVVDFGNAIFDHEHHTSVVSTRHYRAPEVILDLGWNQACDVWSMGCILMEFYLGLMMFQTHDSKEHLAMMERILGPIPPHLLNKTKKQHYVHAECLDWDENSSKGRYVRKNCKPLKHYMQSKSMEHEQLFDLIRSMMEYDVNRRITMEEALWHPFFTPLRKDTRK